MMSPDAIAQAARRFVHARESGELISELDAALRPATVADAHAIQDATVALLGDTVAGWKVAASPDGEVVRGVLLASRVFDSPARIPAQRVPMRSVEVEIAFRFLSGLPPRERSYSYAEIAGVVMPLAAIEVVDSRFQSYRDTPLFHRMADCVSNGAFVVGSTPASWQGLDLSTLAVTLEAGGTVLVSGVGGHPTVDPMFPVVTLVNHFRALGQGVKAGQYMTTGTFTGLTQVEAHESIVGRFEGFGDVRLEFI